MAFVHRFHFGTPVLDQVLFWNLVPVKANMQIGSILESTCWSTSTLESSFMRAVVQSCRVYALATNRHDDMLARANPVGGRRPVDHADPPRCIPRHPQV